VPTVLVRIPGASHNISRRPSHMIAKVANVLAWFEKWDDKPAASDTSQD
jgi:acylaminoacyl-peptidase